MTSRRAFTTIELYVVVAILLIAVAASFLVIQVSQVGQEARAVTRRLAVVRLTAVLAGEATSCLGRSQLGSFATAFPSRGLLFTPDGLPRTCDGGGVGNTTILLEHRGRQAAVIVSSLGRVRWELR